MSDQPIRRYSAPVRRRLISAGLMLALLLTLGLSVHPEAPASLSQRIDDILSDHDANAAIWGVYVQDLNSGRVIYQHNESKTLVPASNQKLLTTATALDVLGSDYRYQTTLYLDGEIEDGTLRGDLIIEGAGDPTFGSREIDGDDPLRTWAHQLAEMGIQRIDGRIIGDDDIFDDAPYAEGWDVTHVAEESFAPASGGLSYRDNVVEVQIRADRIGHPPIVQTYPAGYFDVRNQATTSARRRGRYPQLHRPFGQEEIVLRGSASRNYRGTVKLPVVNPTAFALHCFRQYLDDVGIDVQASLIDVDDLDARPNYRGAERLFVHLSPPLSEILVQINKRSDNLYAEQIFRTFGWGGSTDGGERRVKSLLARAGVPTNGLLIYDGSGLSRKDMVTPEAMGKLLAHMYHHPEGDVFKTSLAQGGERKTTLQHRLRGVPVQAKTGSLRNVRALSGYAITPDGRPLAFTLLANNYSVPSYRIMQTIDEIVLTLTTTRVG